MFRHMCLGIPEVFVKVAIYTSCLYHDSYLQFVSAALTTLAYGTAIVALAIRSIPIYSLLYSLLCFVIYSILPLCRTTSGLQICNASTIFYELLNMSLYIF